MRKSGGWFSQQCYQSAVTQDLRLSAALTRLRGTVTVCALLGVDSYRHMTVSHGVVQ